MFYFYPQQGVQFGRTPCQIFELTCSNSVPFIAVLRQLSASTLFIIPESFMHSLTTLTCKFALVVIEIIHRYQLGKNHECAYGFKNSQSKTKDVSLRQVFKRLVQHLQRQIATVSLFHTWFLHGRHMAQVTCNTSWVMHWHTLFVTINIICSFTV